MTARDMDEAAFIQLSFPDLMIIGIIRQALFIAGSTIEQDSIQSNEAENFDPREKRTDRKVVFIMVDNKIAGFSDNL